MVEGGMKCVKYLVFAFNLLFFIFGVALIGVGAYVQIKLADYFDFFSTSVNGPAIVIIVVGAITLFIGFFGCCGAYRENNCMTMTFAVLIGIILVCEIGAGIAGYVLRGKVESVVREGMTDALQNYNTKDGVKASWDVLQTQLKCCGVNSSADWGNMNITTPESCCPDKKCAGNQPFGQGCLPALEQEVTGNIIAVAGAAVGLGVVELIGIVLACCLARSIRSEYEIA